MESSLVNHYEKIIAFDSSSQSLIEPNERHLIVDRTVHQRIRSPFNILCLVWS